MPTEQITVRLGVPGLDDELKGVSRGYIILLAGYPGSGKTTFASQFMYEGLKSGERGLYVSFVEPKEDFYVNSAKFGMSFQEYESRGQFKYYEALNVSSPQALSDIIQDVLTQIDAEGFSRLAVDSVTAISQLAGSAPRVREIVHSALYAGLKRRGVTTVLVAELPLGGTEPTALGPEEFIADGVIVLRYRFVRGKMERYAEIRKMRGFSVRISNAPIAISSKGVVFPAPLNVLSLPSGVRPRRTINVLGLRLPEGSGVLMAHDPSLDPLWLSISGIVVPALKSGLRVMYSSFVHGLYSLQHAAEACLGSPLPEGLRLESYDASSLTAGEAELLAYIQDLEFKPDVVVIEDVNMLSEFIERPDYMGLVYRTLVRRASAGVTTIHLYSVTRAEVWNVPLSRYYDYVLYVSPVAQGVKVKMLREWGSTSSQWAVTLSSKDLVCTK
ncbi:MAG: RAD55 family ATPase [Acidilobus sp.]